MDSVMDIQSCVNKYLFQQSIRYMTEHLCFSSTEYSLLRSIHNMESINSEIMPVTKLIRQGPTDFLLLRCLYILILGRSCQWRRFHQLLPQEYQCTSTSTNKLLCRPNTRLATRRPNSSTQARFHSSLLPAARTGYIQSIHRTFLMID